MKIHKNLQSDVGMTWLRSISNILHEYNYRDAANKNCSDEEHECIVLHTEVYGNILTRDIKTEQTIRFISPTGESKFHLGDTLDPKKLRQLADDVERIISASKQEYKERLEKGEFDDL